MIRGILFAILFILLAVVIFIGVIKVRKFLFNKNHNPYDEELTYLKEEYEDAIKFVRDDFTLKKNKEAYENKVDYFKQTHTRTEPKPLGVIISSISALVILILVILIPGSFHQIETGTVAVVRELGKIVDVREPGTYFDLYMIRSYEIFDTKVQQDHILTAAYSKDGQTMELEVFLQYRVQTNHIKEIATQYGNLDALQSRIETQTIEKTKAVMSSAEAMTIIQNRATFSNDVSQAVRDGISDDYYVDIKDVVLTNIDFTDEFEKSVEDKVIAEQQKQASITRAEAELEVAKLEAQKKIEEAKGNAESQKIIAQASAEAATYNIVELSRVLGYPVSETYIYSVDGIETEFPTKQSETETCIYLGTKYVITPDDNFKILIEDYLKYLEYLKTWNGELPDVVAGDNAISVIVP